MQIFAPGSWGSLWQWSSSESCKAAQRRHLVHLPRWTFAEITWNINMKKKKKQVFANATDGKMPEGVLQSQGTLTYRKLQTPNNYRLFCCEYSITLAALGLCRQQDHEWIGREGESVGSPGDLEWAESHSVYFRERQTTIFKTMGNDGCYHMRRAEFK